MSRERFVTAITGSKPKIASGQMPSDGDLAAIEAYLQSCIRRRDWHGVSDAANDLRVLEAVRGKR